jgi:hypothetical protein
MSYEPTREDIDEHRRDQREEAAQAMREEREAAECEMDDGESRFFYIH